MPNHAIEITLSQARVGKRLLGGFQVSFTCPQCKTPLKTTGQAIVDGDNCPNCSATFTFTQKIQSAFAEHEKARIEQENQKQASKAARQQRLAQERAAREQQLEQERAERKAQLHAQRVVDAALARDRPSDPPVTVRRNSSSLDVPYGCLYVILGLGGFGVVIALGGSMIALNSVYGDRARAEQWFFQSCVAAVSLILCWLLFHVLKSIHDVLVSICDRLADLVNRQP